MANGFFAVGIANAKSEVNIGTLWRSASLYEAAFIFTVGARYRRQASDTMKTPRNVPLFNFVDIDDLFGHLPNGCPLVGVEMDKRSVPLKDFRHPERGVYLLGAEDHGLTVDQRNRCHHLVQIETKLPQSLNVAVAGSLMIYDRFLKTESL